MSSTISHNNFSLLPTSSGLSSLSDSTPASEVTSTAFSNINTPFKLNPTSTSAPTQNVDSNGPRAPLPTLEARAAGTSTVTRTVTKTKTVDRLGFECLHRDDGTSDKKARLGGAALAAGLAAAVIVGQG
jgi:hypothetical protein